MERDRIEQVRAALLQAAQDAYEDARVRGLCSEGAWEIACGVIRDCDLTRFTCSAVDAQERGHR